MGSEWVFPFLTRLAPSHRKTHSDPIFGVKNVKTRSDPIFKRAEPAGGAERHGG